jgi:hypothetical protein
LQSLFMCVLRSINLDVVDEVKHSQNW